MRSGPWKPIDSQDRCPPPFAAAMRLLPGLEEGEIASSGEAFLGGRMERPWLPLRTKAYCALAASTSLAIYG